MLEVTAPTAGGDTEVEGAGGETIKITLHRHRLNSHNRRSTLTDTYSPRPHRTLHHTLTLTLILLNLIRHTTNTHLDHTTHHHRLRQHPCLRNTITTTACLWTLPHRRGLVGGILVGL